MSVKQVKEDRLLKALSEMEAVAKGGTLGDTKGLSKLPKSQREANGGLSTEGDADELASKGVEDEIEDEIEDDFGDDFEGDEADVEKAGKKDISLRDWAEEESEEHSKPAKKMKKAASDDDSSSDDDESSDDESSSDDSPAYKAKKCAKAKKSIDHSSITDMMKSTAQGGPVIDVSPFIETLVDQVSDADMQLRKSIVEMQEEQGQFNTSLRKSVVAMGNLMLDISKKVNGLMDLPAGERRSVLAKSEIVERFEPEQPDFTKSEVLDAMAELAKSGKITPIEVSRYESNNSMEPNVEQTVIGYLTSMRKSA